MHPGYLKVHPSFLLSVHSELPKPSNLVREKRSISRYMGDNSPGGDVLWKTLLYPPTGIL
jgi:hypothetical protein